MQLNSPFLKENPFRFRFQSYIFLLRKRLLRFVNGLKTNGFCCSLRNSSIDFRKPSFRKRYFAHPYIEEPLNGKHLNPLDWNIDHV